MNMYEVRCKYCNAPLKISGESSDIICEHCGSGFHLDSEYFRQLDMFKLRAKEQKAMDERAMRLQDRQDRRYRRHRRVRVFKLLFVWVCLALLVYIGGVGADIALDSRVFEDNWWLGALIFIGFASSYYKSWRYSEGF